jgi:hypothetical protein
MAFDPPPLGQLVPVLVGAVGAPVALQPTPHHMAGESPLERLALAGGQALAIVHESYSRAARQRGSEPVMVIAAADCVAGRGLIVRRRGLAVLDELTGPLVWAWTEAEAVAELGAAGWGQLSAALDAIGHADGARVLCAVNGAELEARVFRFVAQAGPAAPAPASPGPAPGPAEGGAS